jgi:hypothetical protein
MGFFLGCFFGLVMPVQMIFYSPLAALKTTYFFPTQSQYIISIYVSPSPVNLHGQTVVLGRLSLNVYLRTLHCQKKEDPLGAMVELKISATHYGGKKIWGAIGCLPWRKQTSGELTAQRGGNYTVIRFVSRSAKLGALVDSLKLKYAHYSVSSAYFSLANVLFRPTTVQMPYLALLETKTKDEGPLTSF